MIYYLVIFLVNGSLTMTDFSEKESCDMALNELIKIDSLAQKSNIKAAQCVGVRKR
jgi:hypothetical protein